MKKYFLPAVIMMLAYVPGHAQTQYSTSTLNSSGGAADFKGITYEWSVGEMSMVSTLSIPNIDVTQGLLQPWSGDGVGIKSSQAKAILPVSVYPNPAADIIYVRPQFASGDMISLRLFDVAGRLLLEKKADLKSGNELQEMNIEHFPAGQFLLQVGNGASAFQSFQIQKIK